MCLTGISHREKGINIFKLKWRPSIKNLRRMSLGIWFPGTSLGSLNPILLRAETLNWYSVLSIRLVTKNLVAWSFFGTLHLVQSSASARLHSTRYPMTSQPPSYAGLVQLRLMEDLVESTTLGKAGGPGGSVECSDNYKQYKCNNDQTWTISMRV